MKKRALSGIQPSGAIVLNLAPGTQSGQRFRLRGKGFPGHQPGDLFVTVQIAVPKSVTANERKLFEELAKTSSFSPRDRPDRGA